MQDFYLLVNWIVSIALLGLGVAALLKDRKLILNKVFALFTVAISIWIVASYLSNDPKNSPHFSVIGNYFVFFFSYLSGYLLLWFAVALAKDARAAHRLRRFTVPIAAVGLVSGSPLVVAGAHRQAGVYAVEFGPLALVYFVGLVALLILALVVLHKNIKRSTGEDKSHMQILYRCMSIALPVILVTEFILPAITGWFGLTNIGIVPIAIPVVGLYYSVVKLRLFNLRLIVVRSFAYILTLGLIATLYGVGSYYLTTHINHSAHRNIQLALNVVLIVLAVSVYPSLSKLFRRVSNKLFYRDAYDSQELLDRLNKVFVSTIDLNKLLGEASKIIIDTMKIQYCTFGLAETSYKAQRIIGVEKDQDFSLLMTLHNQFIETKRQTIMADYLDTGSKQLRRAMYETDMAIIVRLTPKILKNDEELGYIFLGTKKSGSAYSNQDLRVLDTIAGELAIAIQNALHFEEIQNFNKTLREQVNKATSELRKTNAKLKLLDETKDEFITMASHQLRTPLTSVKGYLSMVLEGDAGKLNANQEKLLEQSYLSSQRMVYLISDLLNLSRLNTGKFVIEPSEVDLGEVAQVEVDQLEETAKARNLNLVYERPASFPKLMLDETKTHQVVMNFIDNAIYYTPSGGTVTVALRETPTAVEYTVKDTGIGVPKAVQHKLFTKFYRAQNAQQARPDGTGLGLFMAKKVVAAQGGAIIFDSEEGKGSTFGFRFNKADHAVSGLVSKNSQVKGVTRS